MPGQAFVAATEVALVEDAFHHLVQVCRLRAGEEILLLNGAGARAMGRIAEIGKRRATVNVISVETLPAPAKFDVVLAVPKRDALDLMVKMCVELGIRKAFLIRSAFSQERTPEEPRLAALVQNATEQSNNPWPTEFVVLKTWDEVPWSDYKTTLCFDPTGAAGEGLRLRKDDGILTLLGPEGGFSAEELSRIKAQAGVHTVAWPTPILRAPTALAMGVGWVTARLS